MVIVKANYCNVGLNINKPSDTVGKRKIPGVSMSEYSSLIRSKPKPAVQLIYKGQKLKCVAYLRSITSGRNYSFKTGEINVLR